MEPDITIKLTSETGALLSDFDLAMPPSTTLESIKLSLSQYLTTEDIYFACKEEVLRASDTVGSICDLLGS